MTETKNSRTDAKRLLNRLVMHKGVKSCHLQVGQEVIKHNVDSIPTYHVVTEELLYLWRDDWFEYATFDVLSIA